MLQSLAKWILKVTGWTATGEVPAVRKTIFVAASHTSNWDGVWLIMYKVALDVKVRFLAKQSLFWWPLGSILTYFGAVPIDRGKSGSLVSQLVERFEREERFFLALAPEGTRKHRPYWKTGFYQIALGADVPITLAFIDYPNRRMGIGITFKPSGDVERDLAVIRNFYLPFDPRHPELEGPVCFPPDYQPQRVATPADLLPAAGEHH